MRDLDELFAALEESHYRRRIRLGPRDHAYLVAKTLPVILEHARGFVRERLAPAEPPNDGKQTPRNGHPVFVAQHATATCCRKCLEKWHYIERGTPLTRRRNRLHHPRPGAMAAEMAARRRPSGVIHAAGRVPSRSTAVSAVGRGPPTGVNAMDLAKEPADYFPNQLLTPPGAVCLPRRGALLAGLVLFAWRCSCGWPRDGTSSGRTRSTTSASARRWSRAILARWSDQFGLNLYPLILVLLHARGWTGCGRASAGASSWRA